MFDGLSEKLSGIFDALTRRGALTEEDVNAALREVRRALLEADVALDVVREFTEKARQRAVGAQVIKSVAPGQQVVKIVHDQLVEMLGTDADPINLDATPPVALLMVGLQGSGKTTTSAKIARRLNERDKKKVLLASLDTRRPAAMEQLAVLGQQIGVETLSIVSNQTAQQITKRALETARKNGFDVVILDTAGRVTLDDELMREVADVREIAAPHEVLLVADAMTGQDAVNTARAFNQQIGLTGIVLTRMDGDARGGAALSMRAVTGKPVKLVGVGEKVDALEEFHPSRVANRILGMGDIVSFVEKAAETIDQEKALHMAEKMRKGKFDLSDLRDHLKQMEQLGGVNSLLGMLPGVAKMKAQMQSANINDKAIKRQAAIIDSMTPVERRNPDILKASRKKRIASGSGVKVEDVNRLLKMHRQMADMMKMFGGGKRKGMMGALGNMLGMGGMPQPTPEMMEQMQKQMGGGELPPFPTDGEKLPPFPGLGAGGPGTGGKMPTLPGLGGSKMPGLGGFPFSGKKK